MGLVLGGKQNGYKTFCLSRIIIQGQLDIHGCEDLFGSGNYDTLIIAGATHLLSAMVFPSELDIALFELSTQLLFF